MKPTFYFFDKQNNVFRHNGNKEASPKRKDLPIIVEYASTLVRKLRELERNLIITVVFSDHPHHAWVGCRVTDNDTGLAVDFRVAALSVTASLVTIDGMAEYAVNDLIRQLQHKEETTR